MKNLFKIQILLIAFMGFFMTETQAQKRTVKIIDKKGGMGLNQHLKFVKENQLTSDDVWELIPVSGGKVAIKNPKRGYLLMGIKNPDGNVMNVGYHQNERTATHFTETPLPWAGSGLVSFKIDKNNVHKDLVWLGHWRWDLMVRNPPIPLTLEPVSGGSSSGSTASVTHPVTLYDGKNFSGTAKKYAAGDIPKLGLREGQWFHDKAESIKVAPGYKVTVYENDTYNTWHGNLQNGKISKTFTSDIMDLGPHGLSNKISSMKIEKL